LIERVLLIYFNDASVTVTMGVAKRDLKLICSDCDYFTVTVFIKFPFRVHALFSYNVLFISLRCSWMMSMHFMLDNIVLVL